MVKPSASTAVTCDVCGKRINRKADLARHKKTHATNKEEMMHRCSHPECEYKTLQRSNLETHMNVHTGEKPKECPACDFKCGDPGSMTRHRKEIHGHEPNTNSRRRSPGRVRTSTRQRTRFSPYPSSSSGSSSSTGVISPSDPFPSADRTILPELPRLPAPGFPSSGSSVKTHSERNSHMAFSTHLATDRTKSDKSLLASNTSLTSLRGLSSTPDTRAAVRLQAPEPENTDIYGVDLPAQSLNLISNEADNGVFENPLAQFNQPQTNPVVPSSTIQYTVDDSFVPPLPPFADSYRYSVDETSASSVPLYMGGHNYSAAAGSHSSYPASYDYSINNAAYAAYSYPTQATSPVRRFSQHYSSPSPNMGFYPQNADQTYMYVGPMRTQSFPAQRFHPY